MIHWPPGGWEALVGAALRAEDPAVAEAAADFCVPIFVKLLSNFYQIFDKQANQVIDLLARIGVDTNENEPIFGQLQSKSTFTLKIHLSTNKRFLLS